MSQSVKNWSIAGASHPPIMTVSRSAGNLSDVSLSSDRDSPATLNLTHNSTAVGTEFQSLRSDNTSGLPPASGPPSIPMGCISCPGRWRWECDSGHQSTVAHSPSCSTPDPLLCNGECRFGYSDIVVRTAKGTWRRRRGQLVISILLVLGAGLLGTMIVLIHVLEKFISQMNMGQEVAPGELVTTVPKKVTGLDSAPSPDPVARTLPIAVDAINMSLPIEHPEYLDLAMSINNTGYD